MTAPALQATDVWDQNTYLGTFNASVSAAGRSSPTLSSVAAWRNVTTDAGNAFDVHSLPLAPAPTTPAVFITSNDYEPGRARVALFNWGLAATVPVDLSGVVAPGATVTFTPVRAPFGPAVLSASWNGAPLAVPTGGAEFVPLLLTFAASPDGGSNDGGATNDGGSNDGGATNDGGSNDGGATNDGGSNDGGPANDGGSDERGLASRRRRAAARRRPKSDLDRGRVRMLQRRGGAHGLGAAAHGEVAQPHSSKSKKCPLSLVRGTRPR